MEIIAYCVLSLLVGIAWGWRLREVTAIARTKQILQELNNELDEPSELIQINIEQHNGMFYVYGREDNQFMGQGKSKEELEDALAKRFPGKRFACPEKTLKEVGFIL